MKKASDIDISKIDTDSAEFQNALTLLTFTHQSVFLTGKAGTGKSTFLQYLTHTTKKKYVILAPTGIAAVNAGGQTLHSFFKLPFKPMLPDDPEVKDTRRLKERMKYNADKIKLLRSLDLIIIDEVSMVRADTIDFIDRLLKIYCGNKREPFGGKQLLLVGDLFQLEPVITGDVRDVLNYHYRDGQFFFNAHAFDQLSVVPIELCKVYRQSDSSFIELLDRIRIGAPTMLDLDRINARAVGLTQGSDDFTMTLATRRDTVDEINQSRLNALRTQQRTYEGIIMGEFPESSLPTERELILKIDAQVVFVKNDITRRWVNGTIGKVVDYGDEDITIQLEDGTKHAVTQEVWENVKYEYDEEKHEVKEIVLGTFKQYPIKLAWALTIHKSQGLTFDKVIIDMGSGAFSGGQSYVALSRCRSLEGIKMRSKIYARDVFVNQRILQFSQQFNNDQLIQSALEYAKADDYYNKAAKSFDKRNIDKAVSYFAKAVTARNELSRNNVQRLISHKLSTINKMQAQIDELTKKVEEYQTLMQSLATEYVEMGETCREEGWDMEAAISNYNKALKLAPDYALALVGKGLALGQMGNIDDAISCLIQASKIDTSDWRPLYHAGRMIIDADLPVAMEYLLHASQRCDDIPDIHTALAEGYEKAGDEAQAEYHRLKARKLKKRKQ
ncbi:MAG: AAA family ATPase [Bacteroidales bacterium]|nr:AAA family ATPase [Bacteroidales bacterium]